MTSGKKDVTETARLPTEIEQFPDLQGFLKFASQAKRMKVTMQAGR